MPWLSPDTKAGSAVSAGQPLGVVTSPSALMLMRERICMWSVLSEVVLFR